MKKQFFILMALLVWVISAWAQGRTIQGVVLNATDNQPIIGASVLVKGTQLGASTNIDGKFSINLTQKASTLMVSYIGMETVEVPITAGEMEIKLRPTAQNLDEVVVVAYGTQTKESLTGSVDVVSSKEIAKRPVTSVTTALEGMAPGVQVNGSTGTPGSSPSILIRGINSINGTTAPLYVVDGVIYGGSINDINPNDVESISVLKDAASCALYGAKGANGVVLVTTKRAQGSGRVNVTAKISQGIYQKALPSYERLGYNAWNEAMLQGLTNGKVTSGNGTYTYDTARAETIKNYFSEAGVLNLYGTDAQAGALSSSGVGVFDAQGKVIVNQLDAYNDTDWWDAISRNGNRQEYNISATGATDKFNFFGSLGYVKEQGYIYNNDFERYNARFRGEFIPVKYLRVGMGLSASSIESYLPQFDSGNLSSTSNVMSYQGTAPGLPYYEHDWLTGAIVRDEYGNPVWNTMDGYAAFKSNKGYILRANQEKYERLSAEANGFATVLLPYGFEATVKGTMNRWRREDKGYDSPIIGSAVGFGRLSLTFYNQQVSSFSQLISWEHEYGKNHVDAMVNHESYSRYYTYSDVSNKNELFPDNLYLNNFKENESTGAYAYRYRTETYMGRVRYNYNRQYYIEGSLSRDASSKFTKSERWGTFWSLGASWIINKEKFLQDVTWVDVLKARFAAGTAGNDYTSNYYPAFDLYTLSDYTLYGQPSVYPSTLGNEKLHWEATRTIDAAIDGTFFGSRLSVSVGFFNRTNSDLLFNVPMATSSGVAGDGSAMKQWQNIGSMRNTGWEFMISGTILSTKDLQWTAHVDATTIQNRVTKLPAGNTYSSPRALVEGKDRYSYYLPIWAGTDMLTGLSLYELNPESPQYETDGVYDPEKWESALTNARDTKDAAGNSTLVQIGDRYYTTKSSLASKMFKGTSLPSVYGSFGTNLSWKGLTIGMLFTYKLGGYTLDTVYAGMLTPTPSKSLHKDAIEGSWTPDMAAGISEISPNRISTTVRPQINSIAGGENNSSSTSRFLTSSSYLAFKNLNAAYKLPKNWVRPMKLQGLSIGMTIDNVYLFTHRKGMNPTYSNAGGQGEDFVPSRVYSFELTARF